MTPRERRRLVAAAAAGVCVIIYLWMLFAWETAWGVDLKHETSPPWLRGTCWQLQWAVACAALVLVAALCAWAEGLELWKRPLRRKGPRCARVADNASRVGVLTLPSSRAASFVSLHATSHNIGGRRGRAPSGGVWFCRRGDSVKCLRGHAHQFGWDAMVPMALLGVPAAQFSPPFRALGLSHEAGIAFHRVLGRATLLLVTLHFGLYALAWGLAGGWDHVLDETFQVCQGGGRVSGATMFRARCRGVANFFGFLAWCVGLVIGVTSVYVGRPEGDLARRLATSLLAYGLDEGDCLEDAVDVYKVELATNIRLGAPEEDMLATKSNLAVCYTRLGRSGEVLSLRRENYAKHHVFTTPEAPFIAANNLAITLKETELYAEAKALLQNTIPDAQRTLGVEHTLTLNCRKIYAEVLCLNIVNKDASREDVAETVAIFADVQRRVKRVFGDGHPGWVDLPQQFEGARKMLAMIDSHLKKAEAA